MESCEMSSEARCGEPKKMPFTFSAVIKLLCCSVLAASLLISERALSDVDYRAAAGDWDGDGIEDVLLLARKRVIVIGVDNLIPITLPARVPTVILKSQTSCGPPTPEEPSGTDCITVWGITKVQATDIQSSIWDFAAYEIIRADFDVDGENDFFVRALYPGMRSFLVHWRDVEPFLSGVGFSNVFQVLDAPAVGLGFGDPGVEISISDVNADGHPDVVARRQGIISGVFYTDTFTGDLILPYRGSLPGPGGSRDETFGQDVGGAAADLETRTIRMLWSEFVSAILAGDATLASMHFSTASRARYAQLFSMFGSSLPMVASNWSDLTPIDLDSDFAVFALEQNENGAIHLYSIRFVREEGYGWRIDRM